MTSTKDMLGKFLSTKPKATNAKKKVSKEKPFGYGKAGKYNAY